jgi:hypothetical protein
LIAEGTAEVAASFLEANGIALPPDVDHNRRPRLIRRKKRFSSPAEVP